MRPIVLYYPVWCKNSIHNQKPKWEFVCNNSGRLCWLLSSSVRISGKWLSYELENRVLCWSILKPIWSWQHDQSPNPISETICRPYEATSQAMEQARVR